MIAKEYGKYKLVCDCCDKELEFDSFEDAMKYARKNGWETCFEGGEWQNYCDEC